MTIRINGAEREFLDYINRGVPFGPDDGSIAPWAVVASLPFAPEIVMPAIGYRMNEVNLTGPSPYGFKQSFNATLPIRSGNAYSCVSPWHFGLNQGPIVLMIENFRTGSPWGLM